MLLGMEHVRLASREERLGTTLTIAFMALLIGGICVLGARAQASRPGVGAPTPLGRPATFERGAAAEAPASDTLPPIPEACEAGDLLACRAMSRTANAWEDEIAVAMALSFGCQNGDLGACVTWGALREARDEAKAESGLALSCRFGDQQACAALRKR